MRTSDIRKILIVKGSEGSGNFGHAGRPGEVGGSAPSGGSSTAGPSPEKERIASEFMKIGTKVSLGNMTDGDAQKVLEKVQALKSKGASVPKEIVFTDKINEQTGRTFLMGTLAVSQPGTGRILVNDKFASQIPSDSKSRWLSVSPPTISDTIAHEVGHLTMFDSLKQSPERKASFDAVKWGEGEKRLARGISIYAATNKHEYVAEVFALYSAGRQISPVGKGKDALELYARLGGPTLPHIGSRQAGGPNSP